MSSRFKERIEADRAKRSNQAQNAAAADIAALAGMDLSNGHNWHGKAVASAAAQARPAPATPVPPSWTFRPEEIPDVYDRSPGDEALDNIIRTLPITQAYRMWIGKGEPEFRYAGQTESIMIRCPFPDHHDEHPSAWCNTSKNVWYCEPCSYGGDIYDLAAIRFGYPVPDYKKNGQFPALRADMARHFGIQIVRGINGQEYTVSDQAGHTAPPSTPTRQGHQIPPQAAPVTEDGKHRAFQIPGFTSVRVSAQVPSDEPQHSPVPDAAPTRPAPESPAPSPVVVAPPPAPQVVAPPPAPTPALESPEVHPHFQIPGVQAVRIASAHQAAPIQAPPPAPEVQVAPNPVAVPPQGYLPPPVPVTPSAALQVTEPDKELLEQYGLDEEGNDDGDSSFTGIQLDWTQITPDGTFLAKYMDLTTRSFPPEEYHYFSGLAALSVAVGHDVTLFDSTPVRANFNVCLLGPSGDGKSIAQGYMNDLVDKALPHDIADPFSKGVKRISNPASAEYLVREFTKNIEDPNNPKKIIGTMPVRGVVDFAELATLMKRANQNGSTLTQFLIQFFDGRESGVRTGSLTNGTDVAKNPFATVVSTTQPRALREILTQEQIDNGFINRWVFATGKAKYRDPIGGEIIEIDPLVPSLKNVFGWAGQLAPTRPYVVQWSPQARDLAVEFISSVIYPAMKRDQTGLIARVDLLFKKLVLLHTINMQQQQAPREAVEWSIKMYDYLMATYATLDKAVHYNMNAELREAILKAIIGLHKKNGRPPSLKKIGERIGHRKWNDKQILECIQALVKLGYVDEVPPPPGPGRKVPGYQLVNGE